MTDNANADGADRRYYQTEDSLTRIACRVLDGKLWMTLDNMAALYRTSEQDVARQLKAAFCGRRLGSASIRKEAQRDDGVAPGPTCYALDAVLLVGVRLGSSRGEAFAQWAADVLANEPAGPVEESAGESADKSADEPAAQRAAPEAGTVK
ncbi:hypothetical protein [Cupriavidus cauae]|uniref:Bro-N domain-containing protein n=1 Tax=Cupriavidus cauae TaxID=2608999 RepID=A0A5M8AP75_9BURK|nr:hypothetical protein [Cupriavidus cauae]KAA0181705.1 hypothetical protein FX016_08500 [Cupriavidus gilardii]KAA6124542.1 hypothetical protein F1599_11590 [Cupriavidus cauae]